MKKSLCDIADAVIALMDGKAVIHRYDSHSTNSIYLKFDYGVACSLRISDHEGKRHLRYRFNIVESMSGRSSKKECYRNGLQMIFYSPIMVKACCNDILATKAEKKRKYVSYEAVVEKARKKAEEQKATGKSFWCGARLISESEDQKQEDKTK